MSSKKKKTLAEELLESLLSEVESNSDDLADGVIVLDEDTPQNKSGGLRDISATRIDDGNRTIIDQPPQDKTNILQRTVIDSQRNGLPLNENEFSEHTKNSYDATVIQGAGESTHNDNLSSVFDVKNPPQPPVSLFSKPLEEEEAPVKTEIISIPTMAESTKAIPENTKPLNNYLSPSPTIMGERSMMDSDKTLAVTGFQIKREENIQDKVKVSVGKQSRSSTGFASWGGGVDGNLSQADNLRMAQEKILELENENEILRNHNEQMITASEIVKERSDLLTSQLTEFKNDRDGLELSFKNEMTVLKNHLGRKDGELQRAQFKIDELESRLKFDLKKIRVRERELENRLELVRAEKNAVSKNKDEQILDLRRKMDVIQMEVDSYRQKCVELNKQIENSQDSAKRTTRALRLAMANLELQEENKVQLKKAE